jgi:hypothetical protein
MIYKSTLLGKFLAGAQAPTGGRPSKVSAATQQYIARMVQNGSLNGPRGIQEYLHVAQWCREAAQRNGV